MRAQAIGAALRDLRKSRGLTQDDLADQASDTGITRRTIYRIESGQTSPSAVLLWALADALGVSLEELVHRAEALAAEEDQDS
ncbi:XRE family transcriptional regulator [Corynebacterium terpenotabidum Y-11]|uniref:XRE family transcriptional regulator n=1 Tax=Corynebacterium terpenotabidum Y-11 TaxID=1200352 RepID=S4XHH6_9CORY|nr:XRE family transcriptional regulator [Corynebacterium terpenotabidum Y-11]